MNQIFTWGYEAPLSNDYTKDQATIANKIRKTGRPNISEAHDNFRSPHKLQDSTLLFDYFDQEEKEIWKKKFYELAMHKENLKKGLSSY